MFYSHLRELIGFVRYGPQVAKNPFLPLKCHSADVNVLSFARVKRNSLPGAEFYIREAQGFPAMITCWNLAYEKNKFS